MMIGRKCWSKAPSSRHQEGGCQWEQSCLVVLPKKNRKYGRGGLIALGLKLVDRGDRGAEVLEAGTNMGVMAMEITQSTGVVGVSSLGVLGRGHGRNRGFWDRRLRERDINHGLEMK